MIEHSWTVPVSLHEVPETGRRFDISADERTRAAVAKAVGLRSLPRLDANFEVTPHGRDGLRVVGQVSAIVGQICVVTLEPIENEVEEAVDLVFAPSPAAAVAGRNGDGSPAPEATADEVPEVLVDGVVDLGAIATEFLILGIDPYPRKSGAEFKVPPIGDDSGHPFAALAVLKKGKGGNG